MSVLESSNSFRPFRYEWAVQMAEMSERNHWTHNELDFSSDVNDWQNVLTPSEKSLIHQILKLFTESDKRVASMYTTNLIPYFKNNEIQQMLISFAAREGVHQRFYAALIDTLNLPDTDFQAFLTYKSMKDKVDFMEDNDTKTHEGRALSLAKNIFSEGVSLFGSFIILLNFQRFGKMKEMSTGNKWSVLDETQHCAGLIQLFRTYIDEHPRIVTDEFKKKIYNMSRSLYDLECAFLDDAFILGDVEGLTKEEVKSYLRYLIDRRLIAMGLKGNFNERENACRWFDEFMNSPELTSFFEARTTDYIKGGIVGTWGDAWDSLFPK